MFKRLIEDVNAVRERDPAAKSTLEVLLTYSGLHAVLAYRMSHALYKRKHFLSYHTPAREKCQAKNPHRVRVFCYEAASKRRAAA